jgi:DNA-directed RNA polymerase subunit RPC12/RpoP
MRVRCSSCHADYEAPVTRAAVVLVARCEQCGRERLYPVNGPEPPGAAREPARDDAGRPAPQPQP